MESKSKFTKVHRLLHWIMALAMFVLFVTGFLRMYWMSKSTIIDAISSQGIEISKEQMRAVIGTIRKPMWEWHELFAHVMIFSFIARIVYMIVKGVRFPNPFKSNQSLKERLQGFTYVYFYLFVLISIVTGVCIEKDLLSNYHENIEDIHKWGIYWFPIFIILHICGIILAEYSDKRGITSKMIGGDM